MELDLSQTIHFLKLLDPTTEVFTFQTFDDSAKKRPALNRTFHGRFDSLASKLADLNARGACICVMVNKGDGIIHPGNNTCRTNKNVLCVRALYLDLDGAPLEPVLQANPSPQIVIQSSQGRWHAYWRSNCPLKSFAAAQAMLAKRFNGDPSIKDLARAMRLPGFYHRKSSTAYLSHLILPR